VTDAALFLRWMVPLVGHPVQLPAGISEVSVLKARIQPLSQVDQLIDGAALQGGRRIDVIPWLYPGLLL
jgi:hypothetical protein